MLISCSIVSVIETLLTFCNATPSSRGEPICATFGCISYSYCTEKEARCQEGNRLLRKKCTTSECPRSSCPSQHAHARTLQNTTGGFLSSGGKNRPFHWTDSASCACWHGHPGSPFILAISGFGEVRKKSTYMQPKVAHIAGRVCKQRDQQSTEVTSKLLMENI